MSWKITKAFDFCYGHRVWVQKLNTEFSLDACLACRHLHGHQGKITVEIEGTLNEQAMVTDFKHLNWFKKFVDDELDHKFIMHNDDPFLYVMLQGINPNRVASEAITTFGQTYCKLRLACPITEVKEITPTDLSVGEVLEGLLIVPFVPTSERLAEWLYKMVSHKMNELGVKVSYVKFNETPKTSAVYNENNS